MADDLGAAAEEFLAAARECGGRGARDYMAALSVAIDKAQLLTGEATDRRETIRPEVVEAELERLAAEVASRAERRNGN